MFKNMLKKVFLLLVILFATTVFCGYSAAEGQVNISLIAGSTIGSWTTLGAAICELSNKELNKKGVTITTVPGSGGMGNVEMGSKTEDMFFTFSPLLAAALKGEDPYDKKFTNIKTVIRLTSNIATFVFGNNVPIDSLQDIADKKIPLKLAAGAPGSGDYFISQTILQLMGLDFDDLVSFGGKVDLSTSDHWIRLYQDRQLDAGWVNTFFNSATINECTMSRDSFLLGIPDDIRKTMVENFGFLPIDIPAGMYKGQTEKLPTVAFPLVIACNDKVPDDIVYTVVKAICENKDHMVAVNIAFAEWKPEESWQGTAGELHPGAKKYYVERGWME